MRWTASGRTSTSTSPRAAPLRRQGPELGLDAPRAGAPGEEVRLADERGDLPRGRAAVQLLGGRPLHDPPPPHHRHLVGQAEAPLPGRGSRRSRSPRARRRMLRTSTRRRERSPASRLENGSSSSTTVGSGRQRPGEGDPLLLARRTARAACGAPGPADRSGRAARATRVLRSRPRGSARRRCWRATVRCGNSAPSWKTIPTRRRSGGTIRPRAGHELPADGDAPASGASKPAIRRRVVVLPQPLGPSRARNPPAATSRSTGVHGQSRAEEFGQARRLDGHVPAAGPGSGRGPASRATPLPPGPRRAVRAQQPGERRRRDEHQQQGRRRRLGVRGRWPTPSRSPSPAS